MQTQKVIDHIVNWLKDYATKANSKGFVVGVSGGIDSAVVSTLAAKTGLQTLVLEMPIRQKADQVDRAQDHIEFLKSNFSKTRELAFIPSLRIRVTKYIFKFSALACPIISTNIDLSIINIFRN